MQKVAFWRKLDLTGSRQPGSGENKTQACLWSKIRETTESTDKHDDVRPYTPPIRGRLKFDAQTYTNNPGITGGTGTIHPFPRKILFIK